MKFVIILLLFADTVFCQDYVYHNPKLGIIFDYAESGYDPFGFGHDSARTNGLGDWSEFSSYAVGISLKHPNKVVVKDALLDSFYGESMNDSCMYIGYNNELNDSIFYVAVAIYRSNRSFEQIAADLFFERQTTQSDSSWVILGRQGLPSVATYFKGFNCQGLRGQTLIGFYHCGGGYAGLGEVYRTLLVIDTADQSHIVMFLDSAGISDCDETEGVPEDDLCEDDFFRIASTIKEIR